MARLLQPAQQHDLHEAADVQAVGRGIEADVGGDHAGLRARIKACGVGDLVNDSRARSKQRRKSDLNGPIT